MVAAMLLNDHVSNMFATGVLDDQFQQLQMLQASNTPDFVAGVVTLFCKESERIINELAKMLDKPCVDFEIVDAFVHRLEGSSSSIGAKRVKNNCIQFHVFCEEKSKDGCLKTLDEVRNDFYDLYSKFWIMNWLEQQAKPSILGSNIE